MKDVWFWCCWKFLTSRLNCHLIWIIAPSIGIRSCLVTQNFIYCPCRLTNSPLTHSGYIQLWSGGNFELKALNLFHILWNLLWKIYQSLLKVGVPRFFVLYFFELSKHSICIVQVHHNAHRQEGTIWKKLLEEITHRFWFFRSIQSFCGNNDDGGSRGKTATRFH